MESASLPENNRSIPTHWILLALLIAVHAGAGAYFNPFGTRLPSELHYVYLGFFFSQPLLLAFWATFAPQRLLHRILWTISLSVLLSATLEYGALSLGIYQDWFTSTDFIWLLEGSHEKWYPGLGLFMLEYSFLFVVAATLLLPIRWIFGWQLSLSTNERVHCGYRPYQFGIRDLLVLTTIFSVLCGLLKTLSVICPQLSFPRSDSLAASVLQAFSLLGLMSLLPFVVLANNRKKSTFIPIALVLVGVLLYGIIDGAYCFYVVSKQSWLWQLSSAHQYSEIRRILQIILFFQIGAALSVLFAALVMRRCGYRMVRMKRAATSLKTSVDGAT